MTANAHGTPPTASRRQGASTPAALGLLCLTVAAIAGLLASLPWETAALAPAPWIAVPGAIIGGLLLAAAPENRGQRRRLLGLGLAGLALAGGGLLLAFHGLGNPTPGRLAELAYRFIDLLEGLGQTCGFVAIVLATRPLARRTIPRSMPWIWLPAAALWVSMLLLDHVVVSILKLVPHPDFYPTGLVLSRMALAAALVPLSTLAGSVLAAQETA